MRHFVRVPLRFCILMVLGITLAAPGAPVFAQLLAGYEPDESSGLTVMRGGSDPGLVVTWPVPAGVSGAPAATQGTHVLKMEWSGETDRKVEIRHHWSASTFDLPGWFAGVAEIRVDVYVPANSPLPEIVGIWDNVFGWTPGSPVPWATDQWFTVSMNVGHVQESGLSEIFALLFENLAGDAGTLYVDNLRLVPTRRITFAGREWIVKSGDFLGPGPTSFSQGCRSVWVDANGRLHLRMEQRWGQWLGAEVVLVESLGYGTYSFTVESRVDTLDVNEVLGMFTWDEYDLNHRREIDFEFSRWGSAGNDNAQFVVQPWETPGNVHRFNIDYAGGAEATTHVMNWSSSGVNFSSHYGTSCAAPSPGSVIRTWAYAGTDTPSHGDEQVRMNLWLFQGSPPISGSGSEVIISDFRFRAAGPADSDADGVFDDCDACPVTVAGAGVDHVGCPASVPGDFDRDGDVDAADFARFASCASGAAVPHNGSAFCRAADFDADLDVDVSDFGTFQICVSGAGQPANPTCAAGLQSCIHVDTLPELLEAIRNAPPGARICVAPGTYEVMNTIDIARDDITIEGAGEATLFALAPGRRCPVFVIGEPVPFAPSIRRRGVVLRSMRVRGYRSEDELSNDPCREHLRNNGITVRAADDCDIEDVVVEGAASGGIVLELGCRRIHIRRVESFGHRYDGIAFGGDIQDSSIENCILRNNTAAGVSFDLGPANNHIVGCDIRDNDDVGIFMRDSDSNCFTACRIADNHSHGVYISDGDAPNADARQNAFVGNQFLNNGERGIWQAGSRSTGNCEAGNTFSGNGGENIHNSYPAAPVITCESAHACND